MLFSIPACSVTSYFEEPDSFAFGLLLLASFPKNTVEFTEVFESFVESQTMQGSPLILVSAAGSVWESGINPDQLRSAEKELITETNDTSDVFVAFYDLRKSI